jgi:uncharacterized damage-inducible protein DinB
MPEDRDALIAHYRNGRADLLVAINGLSDAEMIAPTLDGWSVKDHLAHIAMWDELRAAEVNRISAGYDASWRLTDAQDDAYNALSYEARRDFSLEQARWELANSHERLLEALAAAAARAFEDERYGSASLRSGHDAEHAGWIRRWREEQGF